MHRKFRIRQVKTPQSEASGQHVCACASGLQVRVETKGKCISLQAQERADYEYDLSLLLWHTYKRNGTQLIVMKI